MTCAAMLLSAAPFDAAPAPPPLVEAVRVGEAAAARKRLKERLDVNASEVDGTTALHWAARANDPATVELLLRAGARAKTANRYGVMPLSVACMNGNAAIIGLLLTAGADSNTALPGGETAMMTTARTGNIEGVYLLLEHGTEVYANETGSELFDIKT